MPVYGERQVGQKTGRVYEYHGRGRWQLVFQALDPNVSIDEVPPPGLEGVHLSETPPERRPRQRQSWRPWIEHSLPSADRG